jgi:lysine 6-dehydrogenase
MQFPYALPVAHIGGMKRVIVLGAGRVGGAIARDLAAPGDLDVTAADSDREALRRLRESPEGPALRTLPVDLADDAALGRALQGQDLAIGAVPGPMGFETLRRILATGVHAVDISFFEEDAFELHDLARRRGLVAVVDAGVAPGLSNLIAGHHESRMTEVRAVHCMVGGVPADPTPPWNYKAPFSPIDVIAEYTRPARIRRDGQDLTLPALDDLELVHFPGVGQLEAFVTDGLRTLLRTSHAPDLVEKTLRWPGHAAMIGVLRDTGLLDTRPRDMGGHPVAPHDLTTTLLFDAWRYEPGEADLTIMRIAVEGTEGGGEVRHTYDLLDRYDPATGVSSMARTTGYTATALARLVLAGRLREPGVTPPETIGRLHGALDFVLAHLRARGVTVHHTVSPI